MGKVTALSFVVSGDFAHFRKRYTTSSPLTHLVPPRHTVAGIIGAILGLEREEVSETLHPSRALIGIEPASVLSTIKIPYKLLKAKGSRSLNTLLTVKDHMIVPFQFIRSPVYRIYFYYKEEELYGRLKLLLKNNECVYSPSLGLAQLLCDFKWEKEVNLEPVSNELAGKKITTRSVAPLEMFDPVAKEGNHFVIEKVAKHLDKERIPDGFYRVVFDIKNQEMNGYLKKTEGPAKPFIKNTEKNEVVFLW